MPPELQRYRGDGESSVSRVLAEGDYKCIYNPKASVHHWVTASRMTESYLYKRAFSQGISQSYSRIREKKSKGLYSTSQRFFLKFFSGTKYNALSMLRGEKRIFRIIRKGLLDGLLYHQKEVSRDDSLMEWVLKNNYLEG